MITVGEHLLEWPGRSMTIPRHPALNSVVLGKYRVTSVIGEGGMGVVLKARHIDLDEDVAIKCLLPEMLEREEVVARFLREAKAAARLKGEHITRVFDVGRLPDTGVPYMVMEYLQGSDLNAIIKRHGRQDPAVAVDLMLQACEAIAEAHSVGVIHRDLKGSNFFVTQAIDEPPQLKVLDFGIATAPGGESELTAVNSVLGTPGYMAPEQTAASRTVDARADIWSLGIVLYELLDGKRPFRSDVYYDLCLMIRTDPPPPLAPDLPPGLEAVVRKCLEKPREQRHQTVAELASALAPFASNPAVAGAIAEQCARLARRSSRVDAHDSSGVHRPTTPLAIQVVPLDSKPTPPVDKPPQDASNPTGVSAIEKTPTSSTQHPKTPTSISSSSGEVSAPAAAATSDVPAVDDSAMDASMMRLRRSRVPIGLAVFTISALIGAGIYLARPQGRGSDVPTVPAAAPPEPAVPALPAVPEPAPSPPVVLTPEPTKPTPTKPTPTKLTPTKLTPTKLTPTKPAKPAVAPQHKPQPVRPPKPTQPPQPGCQKPGQIDPFDPTPVCKS